MEVTAATWIVALVGLVLIALLGGLQLVALLRPRAQWTIDNVYGGSPRRHRSPLASPSTRQRRGRTHSCWYHCRSAPASACSG